MRVVRESEELLLSVLTVDVRTGEEHELYRTESGVTLHSLGWSPDGSVLSAGTGMQSGQSIDQSALGDEIYNGVFSATLRFLSLP